MKTYLFYCTTFILLLLLTGFSTWMSLEFLHRFTKTSVSKDLLGSLLWLFSVVLNGWGTLEVSKEIETV